MFDLIIIIAFCISNSRLARKRGLPPSGWVLRTILAIMGAMFIGATIISIGYKGPLNATGIQEYLFTNPLKVLTFYACEIGGGLFVRYMIDRKPDMNKSQ